MNQILYRWLHISDLHVFDSSDSALIQGEFYALKEAGVKPDFIVVTGDFRHKVHTQSDFARGLTYLNAIVKAFELDKKHVYLVPGNHDVESGKIRSACIDSIHTKIEQDSDSYTEFGHGQEGDLFQAFSEYNNFVQSFYGTDLEATDPRIVSPAEVTHCVWEDKVNLILLNTALISAADSARSQICDIKEFCKLQIENDLPTLVFGHHGIHRMPASHRGRMEQKLNQLKVRAYLCGDSHKLDKQEIQGAAPATYIPQYTCGKSAPQPKDTYSDLCVIDYACKADGNVYVQVYKYEKNTTGNGAFAFHDTSDFTIGLKQDYFRMFDPAPPCTKAEKATAQKLTVSKTTSHSPYRNEWPTFGREDKIKEIVDLLSAQEPTMIWVHGEAGIGKTDLCKATARTMLQDYPNWDMPYIHTRDVGGYFPFIHVLAEGLQISLPQQQDRWVEAILEELESKKAQWTLSFPPALYFDNFEDIHASCSQEDIDEIYALLFQMKDIGYHLLFSSQNPSNSPEIHEIRVRPLDYEGVREALLKLGSSQLFCHIWGRTPQEGEWDDFQALIRELNGHPLAIVLTATMARRPERTLSGVVKDWPAASKQAKGSRDRHSSLDKALSLAWSSLKGKEKASAIFYWALQYHSVLPIPGDLLPYLASKGAVETLEQGIDALAEYNLLYRNEKGLTMLRPIQKQLPALLKKNGQVKTGPIDSGLQMWARALLNLLEDVESQKKEESCRNQALELFVPLIPQLLHVLDCLSQQSNRDPQSRTLIINLAVNAANYFQYYVDSVHTLSRLSARPFVKNYPVFQAFLFERTGNLQFRLGNLDDSAKLYDDAEALYRKMKDDLGLANTLFYKGVLQFRLGYLDDATTLFNEAEDLYRELKDDLGIANTLRLKGELQFRLGNLEDAEKRYHEAEALYRKVKDNLGLANTLRLKGELQFRLGNLEDAEKRYHEAEALFRKMKSDLGLANTLLYKGELQFRLGNLDDAEKRYHEAEALYRKEKTDLGLANTLRLKGDVAVQHDRLPDALKLFEEAASLYRKEQDVVGPVDLILSYSQVALHRGERDLAVEKALEALRRSQEIRYSYGKEKAEKLLTEMGYTLPV